MNQLSRVNQLNKLHREFFKLVDHKMSIEKMESANEMLYAEKIILIDTLSSSIDDVRRQIKILQNSDKKYTLAEEMQAVHSYIMSTTSFNKSISVTRTMMTAAKSIFKADVTKNDGTNIKISVTIQSDGMMYAFEGSVIRNIAEFINIPSKSDVAINKTRYVIGNTRSGKDVMYNGNDDVIIDNTFTLEDEKDAVKLFEDVIHSMFEKGQEIGNAYNQQGHHRNRVELLKKQARSQK